MEKREEVGGELTNEPSSSFSGIPNQPVEFLGRTAQQSVGPNSIGLMGQALRRLESARRVIFLVSSTLSPTLLNRRCARRTAAWPWTCTACGGLVVADVRGHGTPAGRNHGRITKFTTVRLFCSLAFTFH